MTYENIVQTSRETCLREQIMLPNNNNDNNKIRNNNNNNNRTIELMCHPSIKIITFLFSYSDMTINF